MYHPYSKSEALTGTSLGYSTKAHNAQRRGLYNSLYVDSQRGLPMRAKFLSSRRLPLFALQTVRLRYAPTATLAESGDEYPTCLANAFQRGAKAHFAELWTLG